LERKPIQQVFDLGYEAYCMKYNPTHDQQKAARAIMNCKTKALGHNWVVCANCGEIEFHYNSCRNRNCPCCQALSNEIWIDARKAEVIDSAYFHIVMTVPRELNPLIYNNQALLYSLLHQCSAKTILEIAANPKHLGAVPGIMQALHTWGQRLNYHPHIHAIVSGAGLTKEGQLRKCGNHFFAPLKKLMRKFRGKFLSKLKCLYEEGKLEIPYSCSDLLDLSVWKTFIDKLWAIDWAPYIKETFNGNGNAIDYIGRYTNRIAISNNRILSVTESHVTFSAKDYRSGETQEITLTHVEFIRRFLMHVLPSKFQKMRSYGFLSNRYKKRNLKLIAEITGKVLFRSLYAGLSKAQIILLRWNLDILRCRKCGSTDLYELSRTYRESLESRIRSAGLKYQSG
jgi:hypothetical protein